MNEHLNQRDAMPASMDGEILKALVEKTLDNGKAIMETQDLVRKLNPEAVVAGLDQRMAALEELVVVTGKATGERMDGLSGRMEHVDRGLATLNAQVGDPANVLWESMSGLRGSVEECRDLFSKPMTKEVHHRHFLGWPVFVVFVLLLVVGLEWMSWTNARNAAELHERSDVLWRTARLLDDSVVTQALDKMTRDLNANPEQFQKDLLAEEERRTELDEKTQQVNERMARIRELQKEKKK